MLAAAAGVWLFRSVWPDLLIASGLVLMFLWSALRGNGRVRGYAPLYLPHASKTQSPELRIKGKSMEAVLYASDAGTLVLVPDCFEPSSKLVQAHGRFRSCGRVHITGPACRELSRRIAADFDQSSYSILSAGDVNDLFGSRIPRGASDRRRRSRESSWSHSQLAAQGGTLTAAAAAIRAWASIKAIGIRTGTQVSEFVRFARLATSTSTAGSVRSGSSSPNVADGATSREL